MIMAHEEYECLGRFLDELLELINDNEKHHLVDLVEMIESKLDAYEKELLNESDHY